jgi:Cu+-exporting ATPase
LVENQFYLRNAQTIEDIANINYIVFDKTGTLTTGRYQDINYEGELLSDSIKRKISILASHSTHPMSKAIAVWAKQGDNQNMHIHDFKEIPGKGN